MADQLHGIIILLEQQKAAIRRALATLRNVEAESKYFGQSMPPMVDYNAFKHGRRQASESDNETRSVAP